MNIITVKNLTKKYGNITAVDNISFDVKAGDFFAFLGPNGAGKSTTINVLCTLLQSSSGEVEINGFKLGVDDENIRNSIGVVFQTSNLDNLLTVYENIKLRASFYNISNEDFKSRLDNISDMIGIKDILNRKYGNLSGGQKRRADIVRALINEPKILFLDEPTTGLDPQTRKKIWEFLEEIQKKNKTTIFLTTHYMEEAANADKIAIIDNGKIIIHDTPMKLKEKYASNIVRILPKDEDLLTKFLNKNKYEFIKRIDNFEVMVKTSIEALELLNKIKDNLNSFEVIEGNLDQVFVNLTGKDIREV